MNLHALLTPLVILTWLAFLGLLCSLLSARLVKNTFQKRMQETLSPTEEDVDEISQQEKDQEMSRSLAQRLVAPLLKTMGRKVKSGTNNASGQQVRDMLDQAGHPLGMYYAEFMGLKTICLASFSTLGLLTSFFAVPLILGVVGMADANGNVDTQLRIMSSGCWILLFAFLGFSGPTFWLRKFVNKRLKLIRKAMADVVDLIVLAIEAGLGFDQAVDQAVQKTKGPLTDELRRVLDEVRVGKPQGDAFRDMAARIKMGELALLVAAIDQAMKMGVGLGKALRLQATEIREKRMAYIKEQAGKLPVKMMLPLVLFIFPALFVVILGPAGVQIVEMSRLHQI